MAVDYSHFSCLEWKLLRLPSLLVLACCSVGGEGSLKSLLQVGQHQAFSLPQVMRICAGMTWHLFVYRPPRKLCNDFTGPVSTELGICGDAVKGPNVGSQEWLGEPSVVLKTGSSPPSSESLKSASWIMVCSALHCGKMASTSPPLLVKM